MRVPSEGFDLHQVARQEPKQAASRAPPDHRPQPPATIEAHQVLPLRQHALDPTDLSRLCFCLRHASVRLALEALRLQAP